MSDINENLSASFKYSGSVLKVLEQDSYMQDDDVSWGRWTLFRDTTGYTDIWIVRIVQLVVGSNSRRESSIWTAPPIVLSAN